MRPMLSPALVALNRDAFIVDNGIETTVDLATHRSGSDLDESTSTDQDMEAA